MKKIIKSITAASIACALAAPAAAEPASGTVDGNLAELARTIELGDLDLSSKSGERMLGHRIGDAVDNLCAEATGPDNGSADFRFATMKCRKRAWCEARAQAAALIGSARLASSPAASVATGIRIVARAAD